MKERDLIQMFPDATRTRERKKAEVSPLPNDERLTKLLIITMVVLPPFVLLMIWVIAQLGIKYNW